jgi:TolB-like protein
MNPKKYFQKAILYQLFQFQPPLCIRKETEVKLKTVILIVSLFVCFHPYANASGRYDLADSYLRNGDFEMAVEEYQKILESNGPAALSTDIRAMTGKLIALYKVKNFNQSFAICKRVLKLEKYNSTAIFYAGQNLEALQNDELAVKLYQYYQMVKAGDPYKYYIRARYDYLQEKLIQTRVNNAIQIEGTLTNQKLPDNAVAILYPVNTSADAASDVISKGFTQLIITDLQHISVLSVTNRVELQLLLEKLKFDHAELGNENMIPRFGRLLNAKFIVNGTYEVQNDQNISFQVGVLNLTQPDRIQTAEFKGRLSDIFKLEKQIVQHIWQAIGVAPKNDELIKIRPYQTTNFDAFMSYCRGLDLLDYGNPDGAYSNFTMAGRYDSGFRLAVEMKGTIDAMIAMQTSDIALKHFDIIKHSVGGGTSVAAQVSLKRARLQNIMYNLDMGYLPGNDSRKGPEGFDPGSIITNRKLLPEPPIPPSN